MAKHTRKAAAAWMILSMLLVSSALAAREKHGEWLRIEKTDGSTVEGELLKVSGETLFLFDEFSQHGCQVNVGDMLQFGLRRKTDVLGGIGIGLLAGIGIHRPVWRCGVISVQKIQAGIRGCRCCR